jgi:hypothetical protein
MRRVASSVLPYGRAKYLQPRISPMARFDELAELLKRQREDMRKDFDDTSTSQAETTRLLDKIEELRRRAEATSRLFNASTQRK